MLLRSPTLVAAAAIAALGAAAAPAVAATVTPTAPAGWQFEQRNNALVSIAEASGGDALRLSSGPDLAVANGPLQIGGKAFATRPELAGRTLSSLTELRYSALIDPATTNATGLDVSLNMPVDRDGDGTWDTILVYEPIYRTDQDRTKGVWRTFDALDGQGAWWSTTDLSQNTCQGDCYRPLSEWTSIFEARPGSAGPARITSAGTEPSGQPFPGGLSFLVGARGGVAWANFTAYLRDVSIDGTTWTFERGAATTQQVTPTGLAGFGFVAVSESASPTVITEGGNATNERGFASGPATPPAGSGSYRMKRAVLPAGEQRAKENLYLRAAAGTTLGDLTDLSYWSHQTPGHGGGFAPYLVLGVNAPSIPTASNYTGLVFDPSFANNDSVNPVAEGTWQQWRPFSPDARWRCTRSFTVGSLVCDANNHSGSVSWARIQSNLRDAVVNGDGVQLSIGSTGTGTSFDGFETFVDALTVGIDGTATRYDLDPAAPAPAPPADSDGDGIADAADCAPLNASAPSTIGTDANCDGVADEAQQPTPPAADTSPLQFDEPSTDAPPAGGDRPAPLGDTPVTPITGLDLGGVGVFAPSADEPTRRVPVVDGDFVTVDRQAARRGTTQTLLALTSPDEDARATVRQTVQIGDRTFTLPVQRLVIAAGSSEPVKLPLTRQMRRALRQGRDVQLTLTVVVVGADGTRRAETRTFTIEAEPRGGAGRR